MKGGVEAPCGRGTSHHPFRGDVPTSTSGSLFGEVGGCDPLRVAGPGLQPDRSQREGDRRRGSRERGLDPSRPVGNPQNREMNPGKSREG